MGVSCQLLFQEIEEMESKRQQTDVEADIFMMILPIVTLQSSTVVENLVSRGRCCKRFAMRQEQDL